jgi:Caspase domain/Tetratricopeptide repeat
LEQAQAPGPQTERRLVERGPRVALLIGNAAYPDAEAPLNGPANDVRALGDELRRQGFDVDVEENLSKEAMQQALDRFYGKIKSGSTAVIFFSGFGIQSDRQSYVIPVNARIWSEVDVRRDGFSLEGILNEMKGRGARVKIAILDASRRNPYERRFRSFSAGLAAVTAPAGTLVMSSASPGSLVSDGTPAVFMAELLNELKVPEATVEQVCNNTRMEVLRATTSQQVPWCSSSLDEEFSFGPPSQPLATPAVPPDKFAKQSPSEDEIGEPSNVADFYRRGQRYARNGEFSRAIKEFDEVIRRNPKHIEAFKNRCWSRAVIGDLAGALKDCNEALRIDPNYVDALDSRGMVNLKSGLLSDAITDYDAALRIDPKHASSLYGRGIAKLRRGNVGSGESDIGAAKAIYPAIADEFADYGIR